MSNLLREFREFAIKGNVVDLAVGVIIGAAFGKIITSLVSDILMPPIGYIVGGMNFSKLQWILKDAVEGGTTEVAVRYGAFIQALVDFLIVAWVIFMMVKLINRLRRSPPTGAATPPAPPADVQLLTEIRDLLRKR